MRSDKTIQRLANASHYIENCSADALAEAVQVDPEDGDKLFLAAAGMLLVKYQQEDPITYGSDICPLGKTS